MGNNYSSFSMEELSIPQSNKENTTANRSEASGESTLKAKLAHIIHPSTSNGDGDWNFDWGFDEECTRSDAGSPLNQPKIPRNKSTDSTENPWGWFEDCEPLRPPSPMRQTLSVTPAASEPPMYILEQNLFTQQLWYATAGKRPKQPEAERKHYEDLWKQNFEASSVKYNDNTHVDDSPGSEMLLRRNNWDRDIVPTCEFGGNVIFCASSPFSSAASRSFFDFNVNALTVQIPRYRIFQSDSGIVYAEYLVIVSVGGRSRLQFGVWRRHSDFAELASWMQEESGGFFGNQMFKNSLLSWECLMKRKCWFQCLNKDYLELKCFLLERFVHDFLFEASNPSCIFTFLGL